MKRLLLLFLFLGLLSCNNNQDEKTIYKGDLKVRFSNTQHRTSLSFDDYWITSECDDSEYSSQYVLIEKSFNAYVRLLDYSSDYGSMKNYVMSAEYYSNTDLHLDTCNRRVNLLVWNQINVDDVPIDVGCEIHYQDGEIEKINIDFDITINDEYSLWQEYSYDPNTRSLTPKDMEDWEDTLPDFMASHITPKKLEEAAAIYVRSVMP